jgi:ribose transport system substrate-binding protein
LKRLKYVLSIPGDTTYLRAQAATAKATAQRLGIDLEVLKAEADPVAQGQQLLALIQSSSTRPDALIAEPASAVGLPRVAEAAVAAGIAWVISNAQVDYIAALRSRAKAPVFQVSQDHLEVGRIQGRQIAAILPKGGSVLYLRGPAMSWWAIKRAEGLEKTKPKSVEVKALKVVGSGAENAYNAVSSWLSLSKPRPESIQLVVSQNLDFIVEAKRVFEKSSSQPDRAKWLAVPRVAVGVSDRSRPLVDEGTLHATVVTSLTMEKAVSMLVQAVKTGSQPPEQTFVEAYSYPSVEELTQKSKIAS